MFQKVDITNFVIVKTLQMLHSVMELTEILLNIITNHTEDSMKFGERLFFTLDLSTCIGTGTRDCANIFNCHLIKYST